MQIRYDNHPLETPITTEGLKHFRDVGFGSRHQRTRRELRAIERAIEAVENLDEALADVWQLNLKASPSDVRQLIPHEETQEEAEALTYQVAGILSKLSGCVPSWGHLAGADYFTVDCPDWGTRTKVVYDTTTRSLGLWLFDELNCTWDSGVLGTPTMDLQERYDEEPYSLTRLVEEFWQEVTA